MADKGGKVRSATPPSVDCEIGGLLELRGVLYRCVERPYIGCVRDACSGCSLSERGRSCDTVRCSKWDRADGVFVWYVEEVRDVGGR